MRSLALMYHRINTVRPDPWTTCVSPHHFDQHLAVIRSLKFPVTVTFDDGYADNFENALPLLEKHDTPATIFVASGATGSPYEMWWDELERKYLSNTPAGWDWDDPDPDEGATSYRGLFHRYRREPFEIYETRPEARPDRRMMTRNEVFSAASGGLVTIGAHTVTHPVLSNIDAAEQRAEIAQSKAQLEEITGRDVSLFAYPNGGRTDYTGDTVASVRDAGFTAAYAAWDGVADLNSDPFQIPRVMVRDWNGDVFASVLHKKFSM